MITKHGSEMNFPCGHPKKAEDDVFCPVPVHPVVSFKATVNTAGDPPGKFSGNALRFATREEADKYGYDLAMRWTAVREYRVEESQDPVNYHWDPVYGAQRNE